MSCSFFVAPLQQSGAVFPALPVHEPLSPGLGGALSAQLFCTDIRGASVVELHATVAAVVQPTHTHDEIKRSEQSPADGVDSIAHAQPAYL